MNNGELYALALDFLKKEGKGLSVDPFTFGYYSDFASKRYFDQEFSKYEGTRRVGDVLLPFLRTSSIDSGSLELPSTYRHAISCDVVWDEYDSTEADIVTQAEFLERRGNNLLLATEDYPLVYFMSEEDEYGAITHDIIVSPTGFDSIDLVYLKAPQSCIFDYYINAQGEIIYLDEDEIHTLLTDEVYRDGTESGQVVSISKELEWADNDKLRILEMVLMKLGVKMENGAVMQYASGLNQINQITP